MKNRFSKIVLTAALLFLAAARLNAQDGYLIVGTTFGINDINSAACSEVDTCFTLTPDIGNQGGAVWDLEPINLANKFDAVFCLTLGSNDGNGADGFAFVLRGLNSDSIGQYGGGIGYVDIVPSVAIEFDTYDNSTPFDDLPADHTGMYANANFAAPLVASVPLAPGGQNVEDGIYHTTRIVWNPDEDSLSMYFDGQLRMAYHGDIVANVFGGQNLVYWGFTASTGGSTNLQQICFPYRSIHLQDTMICQGDSAQVSFYTDAITSYVWTELPNDTLVNWNSQSGLPFNFSDTVFYAHETGSFVLNIEFNNNSYSDTLDVVVVPNPALPFDVQTLEFCPDLEQQVLSALNPGSAYLWFPNGETTQDITIGTNFITDQGWYRVEVTEPVNQCFSEDSVYVAMFCVPLVEIPNVITPNGDGINDVYKLISKTDEAWIANVQFTIVNRWGNLIYESKNSLPAWDGTSGGKAVEAGVYFYTGSYTDTRNENKIEVQGNITVQR